jgi:hypothetical protein
MSIENETNLNTEKTEALVETGTTIEERTNHYFFSCSEISRLEEGDNIPVGGNMSGEITTRVTADFENLRPFLNETHELAQTFKLPKLRNWLNERGQDIDERLFAVLFAFNRKYAEKYPPNPEGGEARQDIYHEKGKEIKLSTIFENNAAECVEIAALAQACLQEEGISSSYWSGDVLWKLNSDPDWYSFSEEHAFIVIHQGDKTYIYDPANPIDFESGKFPSIYTTKVDFEEEMAKMRKKFVTAQDILSGTTAYFGANNGTGITPEKHII